MVLKATGLSFFGGTPLIAAPNFSAIETTLCGF
jgi:hypothetical protein